MLIRSQIHSQSTLRNAIHGLELRVGEEELEGVRKEMLRGLLPK